MLGGGNCEACERMKQYPGMAPGRSHGATCPRSRKYKAVSAAKAGAVPEISGSHKETAPDDQQLHTTREEPW